MKINEGYIILGLFIFVIYILKQKYICPCSEKINKNINCLRIEIFGVQFSHMILFGILGYLYPNNFLLVQIIGIIFEIFQYFIDKNQWILNYIGGCFSKLDYNFKWLGNFIVDSNKKKYVNPIDSYFKIKHSTKHLWHYSIAEIFINIIFFMIGAYFSPYKN